MRFVCLMMVVCGLGCARRMPTPHDGTCDGRVRAAYTDCIQDVQSRMTVARALSGLGQGLSPDPAAAARLEADYDRAIDACRWNYQMHKDACRTGQPD